MSRLVNNKVVSKVNAQPAKFAFKRHLGGKTLKDWRLAHRLSAHELAGKLGVSRSYVKSIEGGSLAASQKLIRRFDELRAQMGEGTFEEEEPKPIAIVCSFELPKSFEILARAVRCKGCRKWFIPVTPNQKMHASSACRRLARRRVRKRKGKR